MSEVPVKTVDPPSPEAQQDDEHGLDFSGRAVLTLCGFLAAMIAALYFLLPKLAGLHDTWNRIHGGSPWWMALALAFTLGMFAGYGAMFRGVFRDERIGWRASFQITLAGLAASRIFAAGGAGGLVLQAWALRQAGLPRRVVADKTISFLVLTYAPYAFAVIVCGFGLRLGIFPGSAPLSMTLVPAAIALVLVALTLSVVLVPPDLNLRLGENRLARRLAHVPAATSAGVRDAIRHLRSRDPALLGAILYWAFQIGVLWAAFKAFGDAPPTAVLIQGFFVGMLGNLLPIPGGVGGVEGGMIGAYAAFEVDAGLAVVAVLVFRAFTFWLPLIPGVIAFIRLRGTVEQWRRERGATIQSKAYTSEST
jgi:uncharacterized membrane protein YbhN (UPF0104 family)